MDVAFDEWQRSLDKERLYIALKVPRLTNVRYAAEILLFAKLFDELISVTEKLIDELQRIGSTLKVNNTTILECNPDGDDNSLNFLEIGYEFVKVLKDKDSHRYLGRLLCTSISNRIKTKRSS